MANYNHPTDPYFLSANISLFHFDITSAQQTALKDCINGDLPVSDTVNILTSYVNDAPSLMDMHQRLAIWDLLADTAICIPHSQSIVIAILQHIRTLPWVQIPPDEEGHNFSEHWDFDEGWGWRDLCKWGETWWETFNAFSVRYSIEGGDKDDKMERWERWVNACSFAAKLDSTGDEYIGLSGGALEQAVGIVVNALEVDFDENSVPDGLEAAGELFIHASEGLWRRCREGRENVVLEGGRRNLERRLWSVGRAYSVETWEFWKQRWEFWARVVDGREERLGEVATRALMAMTSFPGLESG